MTDFEGIRVSCYDVEATVTASRFDGRNELRDHALAELREPLDAVWTRRATKITGR